MPNAVFVSLLGLDHIEALELKENEKIYGPIVVGYPKIVPEPPPKRPPVVKWI